MKYEFTLTGETALLMHADSVEQADAVKVWRTSTDEGKQSPGGDDRCPAWTWATYLYAAEDRIVMPSDNIHVCLREAGAAIMLKGKKTYKTASQTEIMMQDEFSEFTVNSKPVLTKAIMAVKDKPFVDQAEAALKLGFRLFVKRAKVGQSKHVRVRPRFDTWQVKGRLEVLNDEVITRDILDRMFEEAGCRKGLCDWRPSSKQSPGTFGKFSTKLKQV